jgi:subfamily B ATP-binding cassette protein MsbA
MKTYFRLLSFAKPIEKFAIPYIIFTILTVIFSTLNLVLLAPLLKVIFNVEKPDPHLVKPEHWFDPLANFNYYANWSALHNGQLATLRAVCLVIVISVLLGNLFRYLSQRVMENLRIHTLLNFRKTVFNNVMNLHMGYFSNERKGDIISKVASDVQVVQFSVTGTLQVIFKEPLQLIAFLFMLFSISFKLTLFSMLVIPISAFIISRIVIRLKQQAIESQKSYGNMIS